MDSNHLPFAVPATAHPDVLPTHMVPPAGSQHRQEAIQLSGSRRKKEKRLQPIPFGMPRIMPRGSEAMLM